MPRGSKRVAFWLTSEMAFQLAACAEMLWRDRPMPWRASRLKEMGFGVGLWNWPAWDVAAMLLTSARETALVGKRLGVQRLNLHGTGLGDFGLPIPHLASFAPGMELRARDTLHRICDLAEELNVTFTLENLNLREHPGCPFNSTATVLSLVSAVNRPQLRINLDLYHTQIGEGDVIRWAEACLPWIGEVQVADNPGRCEPGTGEMNWPNIARALAAMGYSGPVGMEAFASGDEEAALQAFRTAFTL